MKITLQHVKIADLVAAFEDKAEEGVTGYGGLVIYQVRAREIRVLRVLHARQQFPTDES